MQSGRDAGDADVGRPVGEGPYEGVPAAAVAQAGGADLAVVGAGGQELGEGELFHDADGHAAAVVDDVRQQPRRHHHPAQPQAGGEGLAGGAEVDHAPGVEVLEGADGLAVVAELAVVVVLQDQAAGAARPVDHGGPALRAQRPAERELVGRVEQHRVGVARVIGAGAEGVPGERHGREA